MDFGTMMLVGIALSGTIWFTSSRLALEGVAGSVARAFGRDTFTLLVFIQIILWSTTFFDFTTFLLILSVFSLACWGIHTRLKKQADFDEDGEIATFTRYWGPDGFWIIFAIFILRGFIGEAYRIPSGSMKPGLQIGDFVLVNKMSYGVHMPVSNKEIIHLADPARGDIIIFRYPPEPAVTYIKRIVGLPGDKVAYNNNQLTINGEPVPKEYIGNGIDTIDGVQSWPVGRFIEQIGTYSVEVFNQSEKGRLTQAEIKVPEDHFFVLGDNRDNSGDSRQWGFVHRDEIYGRAFRVAFSWDTTNNVLRTERFFKPI